MDPAIPRLHQERLIACSRDILMVCRRDGTMIAANAALSAVLGWSRAEILAQGLGGIVHPDDLPATHAALAGVTDGPVVAFTNRQRTASGGWMWVEWTGQAEGDYLYFVGRDVTARVLREEEARTIQRHYVESQLIGQMGHWRRCLLTGRVTWSQGVFAIFGVDPAHFDTSLDVIMQHIHEDDRDMVGATLDAIVADGQRRQMSFRVRRADGLRHLWADGQREDHGGRPLALFGVVRDVTEDHARMAAVEAARHEAVQAMELAQAASMAKSRFVAQMSHELRTPLNAIIGFSEMMTLATLGPLPDHYGEYAGHILSSARFLLSLIDDMLDLARVEAGRRDLALEPLDPAAEAGAALETVAVRAGAQGLTLLNRVPDGLGPLVADQRALRQILLNLLSNAVKFTPPGGSVTVRAAPAGPGGVALAVADTGIGIAPEDQESVFAAFARSRNADHQAIPGTGLGLALVKALVDLHSGRIDLDSAPGRGTTVTVTFPPPVL